MCINACACLCICIGMCLYVCMYVCLYVCGWGVCVHVHVCVCVCVLTFSTIRSITLNYRRGHNVCARVYVRESVRVSVGVLAKPSPPTAYPRRRHAPVLVP